MSRIVANLPYVFEKTVFEVPGVWITDKEVSFDSGLFTKESARELLLKADRTIKTMEKREAKSYAASEEDKRKIKAIVGDDTVDTTKYGVYECIACDTLVDFTGDRFTQRFLDALAPQAKDGISILVNHNPDQVIGRSFDARVEPIPNNSENYQLIVKFYVPDFSTMPNGNNANAGLKSKIYRFTSVSISSRYVTYEEVGNDIIRVYDTQEGYPAPIFVEHSVVYRGAQPRAAMTKSLLAGNDYALKDASEQPKPTINIKMEKELKYSIGGTEKSLKVSVTGDKVAGLDAIQAELKSLAKENDRLKSEVREQKKSLVDGIRSLQKKLGQTEESEDSLYATSLKSLQERHAVLKDYDTMKNPKQQLNKEAGADGGEGGEGVETVDKSLDKDDEWWMS